MMDHARSSLAYHRDQQHADLLAISLCLACQTHPDAIRRALAHVFDLRAIEECARRSMAIVERASQRAGDVRAWIQRLDRRLDQLEKRIDELSYVMNRKDDSHERETHERRTEDVATDQPQPQPPPWAGP